MNTHNGGALQLIIATDVKVLDGASNPGLTGTEVPYNIRLDGAPSIPAGHNSVEVWIPIGESIDGSLGDVKGTFACANSDGCGFIDTLQVGDFFTYSEDVTFKPDVGTAEPVTTPELGPAVTADYLAFGFWLYVPEDETQTADYDFGVFASGGDPFDPDHLAGLSGSATYVGSASGAFYVNQSTEGPMPGTFSADVTLTADFGDSTATGRVTGAVSNFDWPEEVAALFPEMVMLTDDSDYLHNWFGVPMGSTNIYDMPEASNSAPYRGGHVGGYTEADVAGTSWYGEWSSAFFGDDPNDQNAHPTSMAGTFHASDDATAGLTGAFGAHKQDNQ